MSFTNTESAVGTVPVVKSLPPAPGTPSVPKARSPHVSDMGYSGTTIMRGMITNEEFNHELVGQRLVRTVDIMRRTEPQISSTLMMIELPIRSAEWKIVPATDAPFDIEVASLVETNLFHGLKRSWDDVIRHAMLHLLYGYMLFEQTWRVEAGRTLINDIAPRLPRTLHRWWTDEGGRFTGIQQWVYTNGRYEYIDIPSNVLIRLTNRQEGDNFEGISLLRTAYKPYWYKQNFERIQAVGFEREAVGIPVIKLPQGYSRGDMEHADRIGRNMRSHEQSYIALPPTWEIEWLKASGNTRKGTSIQDTLYYLDRQIQQNVLAQFMSLGTTDVGSYALSNDQSRIFLMSLQATARYICDTFNRDSIKPLVDFNFQNVALYPEIIFQKIHAYNFVDLTTSIANLVNSQVIPITAELEDYIYDLLGVPIAPRNVIETSNGVSGQGLRADGTPVLPRGTPIIHPGSQIGVPGEQANQSTGGIGFNDVYDTPRFRLMDGAQRAVYARMASDAGRPRSELRLGGHEWKSATTPEQVTKVERRLAASEVARKAAIDAYDALVDELEETISVQ